MHVLLRLGVAEGRKNIRVGIFLNKNLLGYGYRKQTTLFRPNVVYCVNFARMK